MFTILVHALMLFLYFISLFARIDMYKDMALMRDVIVPGIAKAD